MTEDARPDPDALLTRIQRDDLRQTRGRLRIYFGSSAGVGKTYAMLLAARQALANGVAVVAGVVETHGRRDTTALLDGLPLLPAVKVSHRGAELDEFDLDQALARRPALLLIDELAHTNAPGQRHAKRWQDVEELLSAGIDVDTTLNVQHLESLNDVVGGITGIVVRETLPDSVFDHADQVVMVDTTADELMARLAAGKVYLPAQAERAAKNFFRKGNLMALRELALRRTADRVESDVQAYRVERAIAPVWQTEGGLLCCVGPHPSAENVVRSTARLAQQLAVSWHAVYVETPTLARLNSAQREAILQTVKLAQTLGAQTAVLPAQPLARTLVDYARRHNLSKLVLGTRLGTRTWPRPALAAALAQVAPDIDRIEVGLTKPATPSRSGSAQRDMAQDAAPDRQAASRLRRYGLAALACAVTTVLAHGIAPFLDLANVVMVFLLTVVGVAVWLGRGPAVLAAIVNVAAFDFFFVPPRLSFAVSDVQYLLTFGVMLVVGLVIGQLTAGLRFQARVAGQREARSHALFEAARDLSNTLTQDQAVEAAQAVIAREFNAQVAIFTLDLDERLHAPSLDNAMSDIDPGAAQWALDRQQPAGLGTDTLAGSPWLYLPLKATTRSRGVLALRPTESQSLLLPEQRQQLETFAALTAMAIERVHCIDVAQVATVQMASERLRNSLLSALSHDLRTPLASLGAMAQTLALSPPALSPAQADLAQAMAEKTRQMADMVTNLLDLARIQSGEIHLRSEWQSVQELIGGAVSSARAALGPRPVSVQIDPGVTLVECDAVLIERVLANLLENAGKYTPADAAVEIAAEVVGTDARITVRDHGPGIAPGQEDRIFEKFTRGNTESAQPGMGLGLAICRAIVDAHGGRIWAEPADTAGIGGAIFRFTLPLGTPPVLSDDADEPEPILP